MSVMRVDGPVMGRSLGAGLVEVKPFQGTCVRVNGSILMRLTRPDTLLAYLSFSADDLYGFQALVHRPCRAPV